MTTTTSYGTLQQHTGDVGVRDEIESVLAERGGDFDVDAIEAEYRSELAELLPEGVTLNGDEFYGPHPMPEDADDAIETAIEALKGDRFWEIVGRHDRSEESVSTPSDTATMRAKIAEALSGHRIDGVLHGGVNEGDTHVVRCACGSKWRTPDGYGEHLVDVLAAGLAATVGYADYMRAVNSGVLPAEEAPEGIR